MSIIIFSLLARIIVGAGLAFALGMVWYHPSVFGTKWMAEQPHPKISRCLSDRYESRYDSLADRRCSGRNTGDGAIFNFILSGCNFAWAVYSGRHLCRWRVSRQNPQNLDD